MIEEPHSRVFLKMKWKRGTFYHVIACDFHAVSPFLRHYSVSLALWPNLWHTLVYWHWKLYLQREETSGRMSTKDSILLGDDNNAIVGSR